MCLSSRICEIEGLGVCVFRLFHLANLECPGPGPKLMHFLALISSYQTVKLPKQRNT